MLPVAIFRHAPVEGPGYFAIFLEQHGIPWRLIAIDAGESVPPAVDGFSGLCFMGGPMSVNDPLPWIESVCALIRDAVARNVPVIGHCLGGQLMSKALGGEVTRNPVREIGWGVTGGEDNAVARHWLGSFAGNPCTVFHWHGETFSIPPGATRLLASTHCANQMFALGTHLAMQCHVEMTPEMLVQTNRPSVQSPEMMLQEIPERLPEMRLLSEQLYTVWIQGLTR